MRKVFKRPGTVIIPSNIKHFIILSFEGGR